MGQITTDRIGIAEVGIPGARGRRGGHDRIAPPPDASAVVGILQQDRFLPRWDRSLRRSRTRMFGRSGMMCDDAAEL